MKNSTLSKLESIKLTKSELEFVRLEENNLRNSIQIYRTLIEKQSLNDYKVIRNDKDEQSHFGYYCNSDLFDFARLFKLYKQRKQNLVSMYDFGIGSGIMIFHLKRLANRFGITLRISGCDIDEKNIQLCQKINYYQIEVDFLDMTKFNEKTKNWKKFDFFYFWNPLIDQKQIDKFVENLNFVMNNEQIILFRPTTTYFISSMENTFSYSHSAYNRVFFQKK